MSFSATRGGDGRLALVVATKTNVCYPEQERITPYRRLLSEGNAEMLLVGAAATFIFWPRSKERTAAVPARGIHADAVTPLVGGGTMGAGLVGHF